MVQKQLFELTTVSLTPLLMDSGQSSLPYKTCKIEQKFLLPIKELQLKFSRLNLLTNKYSLMEAFLKKLTKLTDFQATLLKMVLNPMKSELTKLIMIL